MCTLAFVTTWFAAFGQDSTAVTPAAEHAPETLTILTYVRTIRNTNGQVRIDGNIVPNVRLNDWLHLEMGFRTGIKQDKLGAYDGVKFELQTKSFFKIARIFARLSDKINTYPSPISSTSNYLLVVESKIPIAKNFFLLGAGGYVITRQENNTKRDLLVTAGSRTRNLTYKAGLRYSLNGKGVVEAIIGAYDVFNPYPLASPFLQATFDYDIGEKLTFYSYFRYQYNNSIDQSLNDFFTFGLRFHVL